jgi:microcystin-dependent protein
MALNFPASPTLDQIYTDGTRTWRWNGTAWVNTTIAPGGADLSAGTVVLWTTASAPTGWLLCDGTAVSRVTYATLYATIGTTFGVGDNSTTFNVPDLRQRFALGVAASGTGSSVGATGGTIDHTHTLSSVPAHTHTATFTGNSHTHTATFTGDSHTHSASFTGTSHTHTGSVTMNAHNHTASFSGTAHSHTASGTFTDASGHQHSGSSASLSLNNHGHTVSDSGHSHTYEAPDFSTIQEGDGASVTVATGLVTSDTSTETTGITINQASVTGSVSLDLVREYIGGTVGVTVGSETATGTVTVNNATSTGTITVNAQTATGSVSVASATQTGSVSVASATQTGTISVAAEGIANPATSTNNPPFLALYYIIKH